MRWAVVKFQGHQYEIREGQELVVDRIKGVKKGEKIISQEILAAGNGKKVFWNKPTSAVGKVVFSVIEHFKGKKLRILKFRAKSRYRRLLGFRPLLTKLKVEKIIFDNGQRKVKRESKPKK